MTTISGNACASATFHDDSVWKCGSRQPSSQSALAAQVHARERNCKRASTGEDLLRVGRALRAKAARRARGPDVDHIDSQQRCHRWVTRCQHRRDLEQERGVRSHGNLSLSADNSVSHEHPPTYGEAQPIRIKPAGSLLLHADVPSHNEPATSQSRTVNGADGSISVARCTPTIDAPSSSYASSVD